MLFFDQARRKFRSLGLGFFSPPVGSGQPCSAIAEADIQSGGEIGGRVRQCRRAADYVESSLEQKRLEDRGLHVR